MSTSKRAKAIAQPPCMPDVSDWTGWLRLARKGLASENYCSDCTKEHQGEMIARGLCIYPGVRFVAVQEDHERALVGVRPGERIGALHRTF